MDAVYSDDIWAKSGCRNFERTTHTILNGHIKDSEIFFVYLVDMIPDDDRFPVTDNYCKKNHLALWPEFYGGFYYEPEYVNRTPQKLFSCFINRADFFRQTWLYQFVRHKILEKGLVSYRLDYRDDDICKETASRSDLLFEHLFLGNEIFANEHNILKNRVPFCNFNSTLEQAIIDSKISLVIETYFDKTHAVALSEKIFRNLLLPRPFLLFSNPGAIEHLRRCDFDVYDDLVDHSYDDIVEGVPKQIHMLEQITEFEKVDYTTKMIARLEEGCNYNRNRLKQLKEIWPAKLQSVINKLETDELR